MEPITLVNRKIIEVYYSIENKNGKKPTSQSIELSNTVSSSVQYNDDKAKCVCIMTYELKPKDKELSVPSIKIVVNGVFSFDTSLDKKVVHVQTAKEVYPFLKETTENFLNMVELSELKMPEIEFSVDLVTDQIKKQ